MAIHVPQPRERLAFFYGLALGFCFSAAVWLLVFLLLRSA